ncbi:MAG TPA: VOC family protein [Nitriliruptorales bacterium]
MDAPTRRQRFNHVALTVPADDLDEASRADLLDFYSTVFGWEELPITEDRKQFVLRAHSFEQFVFIMAEEQPMRGSAMSHFGMSVPSKQELDDLYERARAYADRDDRVELSERDVENQHDVLLLHNFYVRFLLPLSIEVQYFDWTNDDVRALVEAERVP